MKRVSGFDPPQAVPLSQVAAKPKATSAPRLDVVIIAGPDSELELSNLKEIVRAQELNVHLVGDGAAPVTPWQIAELKRTAGIGPDTHFIITGHGDRSKKDNKERHVSLGWSTAGLIKALAPIGVMSDAPSRRVFHISACHIESILNECGPDDPLWRQASCMLHGGSDETTLHQSIENLRTVIELLGHEKKHASQPPEPDEIYRRLCCVTGEILTLVGGGRTATLRHDPLEKLPTLIKEVKAAAEPNARPYPDGPSETSRKLSRRKLENIFFTLINRGETALLKGAIEAVPDLVHILDASGTTPLHHAIEFGKLEAARLFLAHGVAADALNMNGDAPLHLAAEFGELDAARLLLEHGAAIDARDLNGDPPLSSACLSGQTEMAMLLMNKGADPGLKNNQGWLPLHFACQTGDTTCIAAFLKAGCDVNFATSEGYSPLQIACSTSQIGAVQLLLETPHVDCNLTDAEGYTALHRACLVGAAEVTKLLAPRTKDSFLRQAHDGKAPLEIALTNEHREIVEILIANGSADGYKYKDGVNLLHNACRHGNDWLWLCDALLRSGSLNIEEQTQRGETALHCACAASGSVEIVSLLIQAGAQVDAADVTGATPLAVACATGEAATVLLLLNAGANASIADSAERTPLHHVCSRLEYALAIVTHLLRSGTTDVNCVDVWGRTPLMCAALRGHDETVETLIKHGAYVSVQDDDGKTALELVDELLQSKIDNVELYTAINVVRQRLKEAVNAT